MRHTLIALFILLSSSVSLAGPYDGSYKLSRPFGTQLSAVALNAAAATRTVTLTLNQRYSRVLFTVNYTWAAGTTVTITPTCTDSASLTAGSILSGTLASGVSTDVAYSRSFAVTASANWQWNFGVAGQHQCAFVFSGAGVGASDLVTVSATAVAE